MITWRRYIRCYCSEAWYTRARRLELCHRLGLRTFHRAMHLSNTPILVCVKVSNRIVTRSQNCWSILTATWLVNSIFRMLLLLQHQPRCWKCPRSTRLKTNSVFLLLCLQQRSASSEEKEIKRQRGESCICMNTNDIDPVYVLYMSCICPVNVL